MKLFFLVSAFLFFISCSGNEVESSPKNLNVVPKQKPIWYEKEKSYGKTKFSYAYGQSLEKARQDAYSELVRKIGVEVTSDFQKIINCEKNRDDDNCRQNVSANSSQKAKYLIADAESTEEFLDGFHFVKLKYIDETMFEGIKRKSKYGDCQKSKNHFLKRVPFLKKLQCFPKNLQITKKNGVFRFENSQFTQVIDQKNFEKLFFNKENKKIEIHIDDFENGYKNRGYLKDGDEYDILLKTTERGFLSVLFLADTGEVYTFGRNIKVKKNQVVSINEKTGGLFVELEENENSSRGMIIAILSKHEDTTDIFFGVKIISNTDQHVEFEKLYKMFDKDFEFKTKILEVKK
jgi:hypothetical protein